jgi:L-threonylcarbamoyladenylate synthase
MELNEPLFWDELSRLPLKQSLFVTPTDTVYGIGAALSYPNARGALSLLKQKSESPYILLVNSIESVTNLLPVSSAQNEILRRYWPGPISFILGEGGNRQAFRWPADPFLQRFLGLIGEPCWTTSANIHGMPVCKTAAEARRVFGSNVDIYIEAGKLPARPVSTLVDLTIAPPCIIRQGGVVFKM